MAPMMKLVSNDGKEFVVERSIMKPSELIRNMLQGLEPDESEIPETPLTNVDGQTLEKVIQWCSKHKDNPSPAAITDNKELRTDDIDEWNKKFINDNQHLMYKLICASNFMDIKLMMDTLCKSVAHSMKGKTIEELRTIYNLPNDFTDEEMDQIRKDNAWEEEP